MPDFVPPSSQEMIKNINDKLEDLTDTQIFTNSDGDTPLSSGTLGRRNSASGRDDGLRSNAPRIHQITENDVDADGNLIPTGVFNRIHLVSTLAIIDDLSQGGNIPLKFTNGKPTPGTIIKIAPKKGRDLTIETGGDFDITASISVDDDEVVEFIFFSNAETGITGGGFKRVI